MADLHTVLPKRVTRPFRRTRSDARAASVVLGEAHPLSRSLDLQLTLARQLLVALGASILGLAALVGGLGTGGLLLGAAALVTAGLALALVATHQGVREKARRLVADEDDSLLLGVVARERRRLSTREERERLARSLERILVDARRWNRTHPAFRPLPGVRNVLYAPDDVSAIAGLLRQDRVSARGVALVSQLVTDGCRSPLFADDRHELVQELKRIRYVLEANAETTAPQRLAA